MRFPITFAISLCMVTSAFAGQQVVWEPIATTIAPSSRQDFGFDSDPQSGQSVLFGGRTLFNHLDETWVFDGQHVWTQLAPTTKPAPREAVMTFDPVRNVFVMHGGRGSGSVAYGDTWEFDGVDWTQLAPPGFGPGARWGFSATYDPVEGEVLIYGGQAYGGFTGTRTLYDLWGFDGTNWTERTPFISPLGLSFASLVYDEARGVHVLFGGRDANSLIVNDTWEYSSVTNTWTQIVTPVAPSPRMDHVMRYDAHRGVIVMFGGRNPNGGLGLMVVHEDTWEYDGTNWKEVSPPVSPPSRHATGLASGADNGLVMFGGRGIGGTGVLGDTWEFVPPSFPGSGADCALLVALNGGPLASEPRAVEVSVGDTVTLNCQSPDGTLDFALFALVGSAYPQGNAPSGLTLFGNGRADVWVDPTAAFVLADGLGGAGSVFVPRLLPGGLVLGPYGVPGGLSGQALNLQIFAQDATANPVGLSSSDALALHFQ